MSTARFQLPDPDRFDDGDLAGDVAPGVKELIQRIEAAGVLLQSGGAAQTPAAGSDDRRLYVARDSGLVVIDADGARLQLASRQAPGSPLPAAPVHGQEAYLRGLGVDWLMRYRDAGGPTINGAYCGWQYVGGPTVETRNDSTIDSTSLTSFPLTVVLPARGQWEIEYSLRAFTRYGNDVTAQAVLRLNGSTVESDVDLAPGAQQAIPARPGRLAIVPANANDTVGLIYGDGGASSLVDRRRLALRPRWIA